MIQEKQTPDVNQIIPEQFSNWSRAEAIRSYFTQNISQIEVLSKENKLPLGANTTSQILDEVGRLVSAASVRSQDGGLRAESFTRGLSLSLDSNQPYNHQEAIDKASVNLKQVDPSQNQEWGLIGYIVGRLVQDPDPGDYTLGTKFIQLLGVNLQTHPEVQLKDWNVELWPLAQTISAFAGIVQQSDRPLATRIMNVWEKEISHQLRSKTPNQQQTASAPRPKRPY